MASPELYLTLESRVPDISSSDPDLKGWIGLGGDASKVESACIFYKDKADRDPSNFTSREDTGRLCEIDWACDIDWFDEDSSWRGWIPVMSGSSMLGPWYFSMDDPVATVERDGALLFDPSSAVNFKRDFFTVDELVTSASSASLPVDSGGLPPTFDITPIDNEYKSASLLQFFAASLKRATLDRLGWLRWWKATIPDAESLVSGTLLQQIRNATKHDYESRGYIVEIHRMWKQLNLGLWIHHHVPVYYIWGAEERLDERYSKLNPKLIAADTGIDGDRIVIYDIPLDDGWLHAAASTWKYDEFMQFRHALPVEFHLSYESDSRFFVIDFQGWKRRELPSTADPAYYAERFYFMVQDEKGYSTSAVTFWRWRSRREFADVTVGFGDSGTDDYRDPRTLREIYRASYGPKTDHQYDEETGLSVTRQPPASRVWTVPTSFYPPSPPADKQIQVPSAAGSQTSSNDPPSLLSRLSALPILEGLAGGPRNQDRLGRPFSRASRDFVTSTPKLLARISSRSRSPRRLIGPAPPNQPRRGTEFRSELRDDVSPYTYLQPTFSIAHLDTWNANLFSHGVLIIPDKRVEVCMRYFASCFLASRHIRQILTTALEHRQAFQIGIKVSDFHLFPARARPGTNSAMIAAQYSSDFLEPPLVYNSLASFIALYSGRMADLLARPHARAFIGLGGACSWVAQRWSGESLIEDYMSGPSAQTTVYFRGANDATLPNRIGIHWDRVTAQEIDLLFGCLPHLDPAQIHWLYPPPHILEACSDHWSGEWTSTLESIFRFITDKVLLSPPEIEPKTKTQWKKFLCNYNRGPLAPSTRMTPDDAEGILNKLKAARLRPSWNLAPIADIYVPEQSDDYP